MPTWICYENPYGRKDGREGLGRWGGRGVSLLEMEEVLFLAQALMYSVQVISDVS